MFFKLKPFANDKITLTGFVGKDGIVYWKAREVGIMLNYAAPSQFTLYNRPHHRVKDLISRVSFSPRDMDTRLFTTDQMLDVVRKRKAGAYFNLANKLERFFVTGHVVRDESVTDFPTLIGSDDENGELFQSWLHGFLHKAIRIYGEENPDEPPFIDSQACCSQSLEVEDEGTVEINAAEKATERPVRKRLWISSNEGKLAVMCIKAMETVQGEKFPVADHMVLEGANCKYVYKLMDLTIPLAENP